MKCSTCGSESDCSGTIDKCANCWEVERRLSDYLKSEKGRAFVDAARGEAFRAVMADRSKSSLSNCNKCGGCGSVSVPGELHDITCPQCGWYSSDDFDHEAPKFSSENLGDPITFPSDDRDRDEMLLGKSLSDVLHADAKLRCPACQSDDTYSCHDPPCVVGEWKCQSCGRTWENKA